MSGKELLKEVVSHTQLPEDSLTRELQTLLEKSNLNEESLSLEALREILVEYAQEVLLEAREKY